MTINKKHTFLKSILLAVLLSILTTSIAQKTDTLSWAKELNDQHKYRKSYKLLKVYYANHSKDLFAGWLYAESLHYTKKYKKSQEVYFSTIQSFPDNIDLQLDFANKLAEAGELNEAIDQLNMMNKTMAKEYLFAVQKTLAKTLYWQGKYDLSLSEIEQALELYKNDPEAIELRNNILLARRNWIQIDVNYFDDDQPLTIINPTIKTNFYKNQQLSFGFDASSPVLSVNKDVFTSQSLNGMLQYQLLDSKMTIKAKSGVVRLPSNVYDWTAAIQIHKKVLKHLDFSIGAERKQYIATQAAINKQVMQHTYSASLYWDKPNSFIGKTSFDFNDFAAFNNSYYSASVWLMSPPLKAYILSLRVGYGFNYSDSEESTFASEDPLETIIAKWDTNTVVTGIYDPFFSPNEQTVHSAIFMVGIRPMKNLNITLKANYGFMAQANTPYLFLNKNNDGEEFIDQGFFHDDYNPIQFDGNISYNISSAFNLMAYYTYQKTNFYNSQIIGLTAIIHF